MNVNIDR